VNIQTVKFKDISFINVGKPADLEIKYLKSNFGFNPLHIDDYIHKTQVPKVEIDKNYNLIVLDFPYFNLNGANNPMKVPDKNGKNYLGSILTIPETLSSAALSQLIPPEEKKQRLLSSQVDFFIGKDYLVVLHDGSFSSIDIIFSLCQKTLHNREEFLGKGPVFLAYRIIDALVDSCFPIINGVMATIDKIDKELEHTTTPDTIEDISVTRRNIVVFHTMIKPIIPLFKQIEEGKYQDLNGTMQPFWGNVLDHLHKIWNRLEDAKELIEGISDSNESLLSYRNNEIVKFLTVITSIAFPFVIVNNLYSMNVVGLPYATDKNIVFILFSIIFASGIVILAYFRYRKWI